MVIVGAGFGGLACARKLGRRPVEVVLVDRHDYHLFTPLLYQVATALLTEADIAYPLRAVFRGVSNVEVLHSAVSMVDFEHRLVRTHEQGEIPYDYLVLATGSEDNYFGNQDTAENTLSTKTLAEAARLRNHVIACLEHAARATDDAERRQWLTFVVIGGGPTGVEFAGALLELLNLVLGREYPELSPGVERIVVAEGADNLLPSFSARLGRYARKVLERRGVEVRTGTLVKDVTPTTIRLSSGEEIQSRTVVWSAGVRAADLAGLAREHAERSGRLIADPQLRLTGQNRVFTIGDVASVKGKGGELPMLSPPAMQGGRYVARTILRELQGKRVIKPFRYRDKGTMAVIGRNAAVASISGIQLRGRLGWLAWLTVHIYYLIGFRNRAVVLISWGWNYLRKDRPIRMITYVEPDPLVNE